MCGIVGYVGKRAAAPILVDRLDDLSYRGYDSAGIAVAHDGKVVVEKLPGKIENLRAALAGKEPPGNIGVGHTRWATHGAPNQVNAHPHADCSGKLFVIQNGIIENFPALKRELLERGHQFRSQTDTEVVVHLLEEYYEGDLLAAAKRTAARLEGSFALVFMAAGENRLVGVRYHAPLIVGVGGGENFVASDITAVLQDTNKVYVLENGDVVSVEANRVDVDSFLPDRAKAVGERQLTIVDWRAEDVSKNDYPHYMLKEIYEQPRAVERTLQGRVKDGEIVLREMELTPEHIRRVDSFHVVACGTAYHAALFGKYLLERVLRVPVYADIASEFRYRDPILGPKSLVVLISQSGETADTIASMEEAQSRGAKTLAVVNVRGSTLAREADAVMYTRAGPEIAVASTKAFTAQLTALILLAGYVADQRKVEWPGGRDEMLRHLLELPANLERTLELAAPTAKAWGELIAGERDCYFLGRNVDEPLAREAALKLKEISYVHAEAYPAGELKHGTIALITEGTPVVSVMTQADVWDKMISNIHEVRARGARTFAVAREGGYGLEDLVEDVLTLPAVPELFAPVLAAIPAQLIAYEAAAALGRDVDQPRNLAKSVTVE
jgi:glucosamine--fructose-6-phosphate aminotransferase (isomerizing)